MPRRKVNRRQSAPIEQDGHRFKSQFEFDTYKTLNQIKAELHNVVGNVEYETEQLPYRLECTYTPDFVVTLANGKKLYLESKGILDKDTRRKMLAVIDQHPDKDIRFIFYSDIRIYPGSDTRVSQWCDHHGIKYSIRSIPYEWFTDTP